jgi:hypothetical protein
MGQKRSPRSDVEPVKGDWRAFSDVEPAKWEWRAFWSDAATAPPVDQVLGEAGGCKRQRFVDRYLVVDSCRDNIKVRKSTLQVKQLVDEHDHFEAYRAKRSFSFPLSKRELSGIFPRLPGPDRDLSATEEVISALTELGQQPRCYDVLKERYKRKVRGLAHEWTKLKIGRWRLWSVAVAGTELKRVADAVATLPDDFALLGGYTQLLLQLAALV